LVTLTVLFFMARSIIPLRTLEFAKALAQVPETMGDY